MSDALELAAKVVEIFGQNILARRIQTYGAYAKAIGLNPAKEAPLVGIAMHCIGAICVATRIPIAPLHFVKRADGEWRGIFESDYLERTHVLPHYDILYVTARVYTYQPHEVEQIARIFHEQGRIKGEPSQHDLWHHVIQARPKQSENTYWELALRRYDEIFQLERSRRKGQLSSR